MDATSRHAIRDDRDVNQWLIRHRQLAQGRFIPARPVKDAFFDLSAYDARAIETVRTQRVPVICLNDGGISETDFEAIRLGLSAAFDEILPKKSRFEN